MLCSCHAFFVFFMSTNIERLVDNVDATGSFWLNHVALSFLDGGMFYAYPHIIRSFFRSIERYLNT